MSTHPSKASQGDQLPAPALRDYPSKLYVETSSRCNLGCVMCMKQHSSGSGEGDLDTATFAALGPALPHLDALVLNGVGEPLLNPHLEQFIGRARKLMPDKSWIGFQTNGLLLTNMRAVTLLAAGVDRVCLSMDGVTPSTFDAMRTGSKLHDLEWAFQALASARTICSRPDLQLGVEYVVTRDNLAELPAALEWAAARGATFAIVSHLHPFDEPHRAQQAYDTCSDDALYLYHVWQSKADVTGVDIHRYFDLLWKYDRSPEEQRIVNFVEAMRADAKRRGIALDLKRLFALDYARLTSLSEIFDRAGEVARAAGLDLRLPAITPRGSRNCSFVEQGSAFVSWDGCLHPCYHLWHRCRSFANGWLHPVQPRVFGSVLEREILELWNSPEFRTYRANVLRHDYPACAGCNCSPCDLVQQDGFTQDCYANAEPCGSCLWSSGLFQCLS